MSEEVAEPGKSIGAWVQVLAALVLAATVLGGMAALGVFRQQPPDGKPAACSGMHDVLPPQYVSAAKLCAALNRPDLPALLGTPADHAETAGGSGDWITLAGGSRIPAPEATVSLKNYSVKLSADYDNLPIAQAAHLLGKTAQPTTVLGHPAVLYSDRTTAFTISGSGKVGTGTGGIARCLLVAEDAEDGGGSLEVDLWRQDDLLPDDAALRRVAEQVLPTTPGWVAG